MRTARPKVELVLAEDERAHLQSFARSRSLPPCPEQSGPHRVLSGGGQPDNATAERLKPTKAR
jgi:putative transposase